MYDDDSIADTENVIKAISILNKDYNDHIAIAFPIPNSKAIFDHARKNNSSEEQQEKVKGNVNDTVIIIFTSGTTSGINKGVRISSRSLFIQSKAKTIQPCNYNKGTNMMGSICIPPLFHIGGISSILGTILVGGCLIFPYSTKPTFDAKTVLSCISHPFRKNCVSSTSNFIKITNEYVNTLVVVPAMLHSLMEENQKHQNIAYPSIKLILVGGQSMTIPQRKRAKHIFPNAKFVQTYACTEATSSITFADLSNDNDINSDEHGDYVGVTPPHIQIKIFPMNDNDTNIENVLTNKQVGIIATRGIHVMNGYWKRANTQNNNKNLSPNEWLLTSDLGYITHQKINHNNKSLLYFCGRKHDVIRTGGETVFALEIENILQKLKDISSCAVIPLHDERLGEIITAAIVLSSSSDYNTTAYLSINVNDTRAYKYVKANDAFT